MNGLKFLIIVGIVGLFLASNVHASGHYVQVTNMNDGTSFWAYARIAKKSTQCVDTDNGFYPGTPGQIDVTLYTGNSRTMHETPYREYACGYNIAITGWTIQPHWAIAFDI